MHKVKVFISSTCYDLSQIRADLEAFIKDIGYQPILSDSREIAIPEGLDKIEACKWLVRNSDIFVLIIGGRYGSTDRTTGKSIVSIEYETARSAKLPIYVFVDKDVWEKLEAYNSLKGMLEAGDIDEAKMKAVLGAKIEDARVFELIKQIDTVEGKWMKPFQNASDIIDILKNNWSLEFKTLLTLRVEKLRYYESKDKSKPILSLSWLLDDKPSKILKLKKPKIYTKEELVKKYKSLMVPLEVAKEIEDKKEKLKVIFKNINHQKLGFKQPVADLDSLIARCARFNSQLENYIHQIDSNLDDFLVNIDAHGRLETPNFQINNDGDEPAQDVIVYIEIPEQIRVVEEQEAPYIWTERPVSVNALLAILKDLENWYKKAEEIEKKPVVIPSIKSWSDMLSSSSLSAAGLLGGGLNLGGSVASSPSLSSSSSKARSVYLEDSNIRINMSISKLKHGFVYKEDSNLSFYLGSIKADKKIMMNYKCFADNLRSPDIGELVIETI